MNYEIQNRSRRDGGFTLVEIMVVIVILGLLATMVAQSVMGSGEKARIGTTQASVKTLSDAVKHYYLEKGHLPESLEELVTEDEDGRTYLEALEKDPWGNDFILRGDTGRDFEVLSCGPDGSEDTDDDISSKKRDKE